ncbi:hypothetical protein [Aestuariibius sp. HNIBRBA575]|uniref:hypothetical protein n=1 Tax=Aestuariibius sp. HNIBRBA575 TaxID=3233343 RepID=UPI0034A0E34F
MTARRIIIHAGFHKTGTTTIQNFLRHNGKLIYPHSAMLLPGKLRSAAAAMALRYSSTGRAVYATSFGEELREMMSNISVGKRSVLISDENLIGRMPGRDGQLGYPKITDLILCLRDAVLDSFGPDLDIHYVFTTRDRDAWLQSLYQHNVTRGRLTQNYDEFDATLRPYADLAPLVEGLKEHLGAQNVHAFDLADLAKMPFGPASPIVDLLSLPAKKGAQLQPVPSANISVTDDILMRCLELNRTTLDDKDINDQKVAMLVAFRRKLNNAH